MPEFVLTADSPEGRTTLASLDPIVRGYVEAAFFTDETAPEVGVFEELDDAALARAVADCDAFRAATGSVIDGLDEEIVGNFLWYSRTGAGSHFEDGTFAQPAAGVLAAGAQALGGIESYRGEDGKIYFM